MQNKPLKYLRILIVSFVLIMVFPSTVKVEAYEEENIIDETSETETVETEEETTESNEPDEPEVVEDAAPSGFGINLLFQVNNKQYPILELTESKIHIFLKSDFNPLSYIASMNDGQSDTIMPTLKITNNVNVEEEGVYLVKYLVTNEEGLSTQRSLVVDVFEGEHQKEAKAFMEKLESISEEELTYNSDDVINDIFVAYMGLSEDAIKELDIDYVKAKLASLYIMYQEQISKENHRQAVMRSQSTANARNRYVTYTVPSYSNVENVYPGTNWNNCTWAVWQLVYDNMGISLPPWGDAKNWYKNAESQGWPVGSEPRVNSIVVLSNHVCWVREVDGALIYIQEGNWGGVYHEGWMPAYGDRNGMTIYGYIYLD